MGVISRRFDAMIGSGERDIGAIASACESDAMASILRQLDAMITSNDRDIEATASECASDAAMALIPGHFLSEEKRGSLR